MANKDRVQGKAKEAIGSVQEKAGQLTGDRDMEAEGTARKYEGKGQNFVGKVKGKVEDVKDAVIDR